MGRWGISDLVDASPDVVGLLSHFASADVDPEFTGGADRAVSERSRRGIPA